ncbi:MAG: hypothetical protein V3R86_02340 [Candidatus Hydrothermarchaeaceae archaeon]
MVDIKVFGVGSTDNAREEYDKCGIEQFSQGMVSVAPPCEEAEKAEGFVRKLRKQAKPGAGPVTPHSMYQ